VIRICRKRLALCPRAITVAGRASRPGPRTAASRASLERLKAAQLALASDSGSTRRMVDVVDLVGGRIVGPDGMIWSLAAGGASW